MRLRAVVVLTLLVAACSRTERTERGAAPDAAPLQAASSLAEGDAGRPPAPPSAVSPAIASPRAPRAVAIPAKDWAWRTYRGDRFSIVFPGEPKVTVLPADDDKIGYTEALLDVPGGQVSFAAGFSEHPQEEVAVPEAFLDEHAGSPRRGFTDVLHKRSITLPGGHPGRVLILRRNISGTPLRVYSRLHLVGRRLYSLIVSTLDEGGIGEDVVKKFMESFRLSS